MTVVAAALMPDGVVMAADCRLTMTRPSGQQFVADDAQKIVLLGEHTAVGFSGDVHTVSLLFGQLHGPQLGNRKLDGVSVRQWLPRFCAATYKALLRTHPKELGQCAFLVASTVPGRNQRVNIRDALSLRTASSGLGPNNYLVMRILNEINAPDGFATIPESSYGLLYSLRSPDFVPQDYPCLRYAAIGSGAEDVLRSLSHYAEAIFTDDPALSVGWFMEAFASAFASTAVPSVGGMFLTTAMAEGKIDAMLPSATEPNGGAAVLIENGRFVQLDRVSGRRLALRYPSEIDRDPASGPTPFTPYRSFWTPPPPLSAGRFPMFHGRASDENRTKQGVVSEGKP